MVGFSERRYNLNMIRRLLGFSLFVLASLTQASKIKNSVLVSVAGKAITERGLVVEAILAGAKYYNPEQGTGMNSEERDRLLQKLVIRSMVEEENRVLSLYKVSKAEIDNKVADFKKVMGADRYQKFIENYELTESDLRERLAANLMLEKVLASQEDLERWLKQLRSRHKVVYMKSPGS